MRRVLLAGLLLCVFPPSALALELVGVFDQTGMPLLERLLAGSGVFIEEVDPDRVEYVGVTDGAGAQAALFDELALHGENNTELRIGPGIVLTSGLITGLPSTNTSGSYSNVTGTGGNNYFRDFPAQTGSSRHGGRLDERDENSLVFELDAASDVQGMTLQFVYGSDEFPEWSGTQFADGFVFIVDGVNYATLPDGRPVSLLRQEDNIHFLTNGQPGDPSVPLVANVEYDGLTRVLELTAPLTAGNRNRITIAIGDTGDEIYDSAVFLSSLRLLTGDAPLPEADLGVKVRHTGDDDLFNEPGDFDADGDVDGADFLAWQVALGSTRTAADLASWQNHFGQAATAPAGAVESVPEPAANIFLAWAFAAIAAADQRLSMRNSEFKQKVASESCLEGDDAVN